VLSQVDKIKELLLPILTRHQAQLVELEVKGRPGSQMLKIFVDTPEGIKLETCERISRELSDELDIADIFSGKYRMEVSSPGLNRPLTKPADFERNMNREVKVYYTDGEKAVAEQGKLAAVSEEYVELSKGETKITIPFSTIEHGEVCLPW